MVECKCEIKKKKNQKWTFKNNHRKQECLMLGMNSKNVNKNKSIWSIYSDITKHCEASSFMSV